MSAAASTYATQVQEARSHGYTDDQILGYLSEKKPDLSPKIQEATREGYKPGEILDHLSSGTQQQPVSTPQQEDPGFLSNLVTSAKNAATGAVQSLAHPVDTAKALVETLSPLTPGGLARTLQGDNPTLNAVQQHYLQRYGSLDAVKQTAYKDPVGFALDAAQVLGPLAEASGVSLVPRALAARKVPITPGITPALDASEQATVQFADRAGIPIDAATRTGSPVIRNAQGFLQNSLGGSGVAKQSRVATTQAMTRTGDDLLSSVAPNASIPETAGAGVQDALNSRVARLRSQAGTAYDTLEQIQNDPENVKTVQVGSKQVNTGVVDASGKPVITNQPITKQVALPVDMRPIKQALQPIYEEIRKQLPVGQQQHSKALVAIQNTLDGDDVIPASQAEQNLSALKAIQREAPNAKTQWLAQQAIAATSKAVDQTVATAGPSAQDALQQGRQLTAAKYATKGTLDSLQTEPVKLFNQLTTQKDLSINLLRDVQSKAPDSMPAVGRAYLQGLIDKAFAEAGTDKPGAALTQWQNLGDQTKQILFKSPQTVQNIDNFFTLAKKVSENPNPSGTAYVAQLAVDGSLLIKAPHLAAGYIIGKNALARMLFNSKSAEALTNGLKIPVKSGGVATLMANQLLKLAGTDAQPVTLPEQRTSPVFSAPSQQ